MTNLDRVNEKERPLRNELWLNTREQFADEDMMLRNSLRRFRGDSEVWFWLIEFSLHHNDPIIVTDLFAEREFKARWLWVRVEEPRFVNVVLELDAPWKKLARQFWGTELGIQGKSSTDGMDEFSFSDLLNIYMLL